MRKPEIMSAEFVKSVKGSDEILEDGTPQVAFVGRSNVGKSSLINSLVGKKLAISSSTPGRTRLINIFIINGKRYFLDLPGYGFARFEKKDAERMQKMLLWYLADSEITPRATILIVDAKVGPTKQDEEMMNMLHEGKHRVIVVANKIDKLKRSERARALGHIKEALAAEDVIAYSAKTKEGREGLLEKVLS